MTALGADSSMNEIGKGKAAWAKGGGKAKGPCHGCGKMGHLIAECWSKGKGKGKATTGTDSPKGKSKGAFKGACYNCGKNGHRAPECYSAKGKGKGNLGKANEVSAWTWPGQMYQVENQNEEWQQPEEILSFGGSIGAMQEGTGRNNFLGNLYQADSAKEESANNEWKTVSRKVRKSYIDLTGEDAEVPCRCIGSLNVIKDPTQWVGEWEQIRVNIDSGAIDSVCNKSTGKMFSIKETAMSKQNGYYLSASKHKMYNKGEKAIIGLNDNGVPSGMAFQICDVRSPLGSVKRICKAGNRVIFDDEASYIENKKTGARTPIEDSKDGYHMNLWAPSIEDAVGAKEETGNIEKVTNESGFIRQGS